MPVFYQVSCFCLTEFFCEQIASFGCHLPKEMKFMMTPIIMLLKYGQMNNVFHAKAPPHFAHSIKRS